MQYNFLLLHYNIYDLHDQFIKRNPIFKLTSAIFLLSLFIVVDLVCLC